jgi:cytochrome c oxidase subunit 2
VGEIHRAEDAVFRSSRGNGTQLPLSERTGLGTVDARFVSESNPFSINQRRSAGQDDILIATPVVRHASGKSAADLRSIDVLHDFTVPQFQAMNMAPARHLCLVHPPKPGRRRLANSCAARPLRDAGHRGGRDECRSGVKKALPTSRRPSPGRRRSRAGAPLFAVFASCHGAQAEGNPGINAPKRSGQQDWYLRRQLKNFKDGARGVHDKDVYGKMMAPMAATLPDDAAINNVVAYIKTLPDTPAPPTVKGDAKEGHGPYVNCAAVTVPTGRAFRPRRPRG